MKELNKCINIIFIIYYIYIMDIVKYSPITKVIHQIWLGPFDPPVKWINSWKDGFCKKYNWDYILWDEKSIDKLGLINKKEYEESISYQQKSDIVRYEIMYKFGGCYIDCDMIWLGHNLEKYIPFNTNNFIGVQEFPSKSINIIGSPYLSNGFFACSPNHKILKRCINEIPKRVKMPTIHTFIKTGPTLLNSSIKEIICIIPYNLIFPKDFHKKTNVENPLEFSNIALVFTYNGGEYPHLKKLNKLKLG